MQKLMALGIRLKQLGPLGARLANAIDPPNQQGQQQQQAAQMQAQAAQMGQQLQELQGLVQKLMLERQGKLIDNAFKASEGDKNRENALAIAEVETKAQAASERTETFNEMQQQFQAGARGSDAVGAAAGRARAGAAGASRAAAATAGGNATGLAEDRRPGARAPAAAEALARHEGKHHGRRDGHRGPVRRGND